MELDSEPLADERFRTSRSWYGGPLRSFFDKTLWEFAKGTATELDGGPRRSHSFAFEELFRWTFVELFQ